MRQMRLFATQRGCKRPGEATDAIFAQTPCGLLEPNLGLKTKEGAAKAMTVDVFSFLAER